MGWSSKKNKCFQEFGKLGLQPAMSEETGSQRKLMNKCDMKKEYEEAYSGLFLVRVLRIAMIAYYIITLQTILLDVCCGEYTQPVRSMVYFHILPKFRCKKQLQWKPTTSSSKIIQRFLLSFCRILGFPNAPCPCAIFPIMLPNKKLLHKESRCNHEPLATFIIP